MDAKRFFAHGKILISGEYAVLKGARALAIPSIKGQQLSISEGSEHISWESVDYQGNTWFKAHFNLDLSIISSWDDSRAEFIQLLLKKAFQLSGSQPAPLNFCSFLEFPAEWGLGSSSSLTYLIASYFNLDPFSLFFSTQNGSGYDIACAGSDQAILYQLINGQPQIETCKIPEAFRESFFIYLNKKQDSRKEVAKFRELPITKEQIDQITSLTESFTRVQNPQKLIELCLEHEAILSSILGVPTVGDQLFSDYQGGIKSLGAWGGDFIMAIGDDTENYFRERGFRHILSFNDMFGSLGDK